MKDFIFGFLSIPMVCVIMGFYFWLTYNATGNSNFMLGEILGGLLLLAIVIVLLSLIKIVP